MTAAVPAAPTPAAVTPRRRGMAALAALIALALSVVLITSVTSATWTDTTRNDDNAWATATVSLTDDAPGGVALFAAQDMVPGSEVDNAITVTNDSSVALNVRLYGEDLVDSTESLAAHLNLKVGTSAGDGDVFDGTLAGFGASHDGYAQGTPVIALTAAQSQTYHFWVQLDDAAPQTLAGDSAAIDFVWEGQTQ